MKTRNKIILLLALALTCMITSCESYLDTMPDQRTELNSVRKVKDLLMSAFLQLHPYKWKNLCRTTVWTMEKNMVFLPIY